MVMGVLVVVVVMVLQAPKAMVTVAVCTGKEVMPDDEQNTQRVKAGRARPCAETTGTEAYTMARTRPHRQPDGWPVAPKPRNAGLHGARELPQDVAATATGACPWGERP
jgi:hypothetical protein